MSPGQTSPPHDDDEQWSVSGVMRRHFTVAAPTYRGLRTTDPEPVDVIGSYLPSNTAVVVADIGTGTGRYAELLHQRLERGSRVIAFDQSEGMIRELVRGSRRARDLEPALAAASSVPLRAGSLDAVTTFNAVHHFDLPAFLCETARVLRVGGLAFVYTRTPDQNARTIWGRYFPEFTARETRLFDMPTLCNAVRQTGALTPVATREFQFPRRSTSARLRELVEARHYSTFCFYAPDELVSATYAFLSRLPGPKVTWVDENLLMVARRDS